MKYSPFSQEVSCKLLRLVFVTSILLLFFAQVIDYLNFGVDDVFISMRFAENAARGNGLVYNIGENVEGYSNPLWVVLLVAAASLGLNSSHSAFGLLWFAKGMSFVFGIGVLVLLFFIAKKLERKSDSIIPLRLLVLLIAVSCGPFVLWCCGGLESLVTAFFLTLSIFLFQKIWQKKENEETVPLLYFILFSITLALASLTRPEPLLHAVMAIGFTLYGLRRSLRRIEGLSLVLPFFIIFSIFMAWRYLTYHDILPNTFYAKTGGGFKSYLLSMKYILGGVCMIGGPLILAIPFASQNRASSLFKYCQVLVAASLVFMLYSGGDWMAGFRFFIPVAPIFFLAIAAGMSGLINLLNTGNILSKAGVSKFLLFILFLSFSTAFADRILIRGQIQTMGTGFSAQTGHSSPWNFEVGSWIRHHGGKSSLIATGEAGLIAYLNLNMRVIDLSGLADIHIAQNLKLGIAANASYVLDQKPDYIILPSGDAESVILSDSRPTFSYYSAIAQSKDFKKEYHIEKRFMSLDLLARN